MFVHFYLYRGKGKQRRVVGPVGVEIVFEDARERCTRGRYASSWHGWYHPRRWGSKNVCEGGAFNQGWKVLKRLWNLLKDLSKTSTPQGGACFLRDCCTSFSVLMVGLCTALRSIRIVCLDSWCKYWARRCVLSALPAQDASRYGEATRPAHIDKIRTTVMLVVEIPTDIIRHGNHRLPFHTFIEKPSFSLLKVV